MNTDTNGESDLKVSDFTYELRLDVDPGAGTDFNPLAAGFGLDPFDPIIPGVITEWDHAFGNNGTGNGGGTTKDDVGAPSYADLLTSNNVVQNSWAYAFFPFIAVIDPNQAGIYTIELEAFLSGASVASSSIDVVVSAVPVPAALPLFLSGLLGLGIIARRRRKVLA
ncbi:MAG: PEP-CTERM sorting domain-containing protein [Proteobacteria bacterium]|nr:PEP-CTERM sorting domain-containing protein [Pseudomonadota bacterium]